MQVALTDNYKTVLAFKKRTSVEVSIEDLVLERVSLFLGSLYKQPYLIPTYDGTLLLEYNYKYKDYEGYSYVTFEIVSGGIDLYFTGDHKVKLTSYRYKDFEGIPITRLAVLDWMFINKVLSDLKIIDVSNR